MSSIGDLGAEFLNEIAAEGASATVEILGVNADAAALMGEELTVRMCAKFGKQQIYIAQSRIFKAARPHELIAEELGRHDANFLAKKHGGSRQHIYRVAARINEAEKARRQGKLSLE